MSSRGWKLNNPGNIKKSSAPWLGKVPSNDPVFERFDNVIHGIRAAAKIFIEYNKSHGLSTVAQFLQRWAPPSDHNPTTAYVDFVAKHCGVDSNNTYNVLDSGNLCRLLDAIFRFEQGGEYATAEQIKAGVDEALGIIRQPETLRDAPGVA